MAPPRILLGVTGSIAAMHTPTLAHSLCGWAEVRIVVTRSAVHYVDRTAFPVNMVIHTNEDEWRSRPSLGNELLHIRLRQWADAMLIAPLSPHTMAKVAYGLCNSLLTLIVRAWDPSKPLFVAPCMHRFEWTSCVRETHAMILQTIGLIIVSGENSAMADVPTLDGILARHFLDA